jgi:hypothetical protein
MTIEQLDFEVGMILADKKTKGIGPHQCDMLELHEATGVPCRELLPLMRRLVTSGRYEGSITINKIPILR